MSLEPESGSRGAEQAALKAILAGAIRQKDEPNLALLARRNRQVLTLKEYDESNAPAFESNLDRRFSP
jgi:hypothetical protein